MRPIYFVIAAVLLLGYVWMNMECVSTGYDLTKLSKKKQELLNDNRMLQVEAASLRASERIETIARNDLGFITPDKFETLMSEEKTNPKSGVMESVANFLKKAGSFILSIF